MSSLSSAIAALSQELQDMICDEVVKPPPTVRYLDEVAERLGYHQPRCQPKLFKRPLLPLPASMNRGTIEARSRKVFLKHFYGAVFVVPYLNGRSADFLVQWLKMLDKKDLYRIEDIRCITVQGDGIIWSNMDEAKARGKLRELRMEHAVRFGSESEVTADLDGYQSQSQAAASASTATAEQEQPGDAAPVSPPVQSATPPAVPQSNSNFRGEGRILGSTPKTTGDVDWSEDEEEEGAWDEDDEDDEF